MFAFGAVRFKLQEDQRIMSPLLSSCSHFLVGALKISISLGVVAPGGGGVGCILLSRNELC